MEAQELLRRAARVFQECQGSITIPTALCQAAGMSRDDMERLNDGVKNPALRGKQFLEGVAAFLDQREAKKNNPDDGVQDGDILAYRNVLPYSRAVEKIAQDRCCAIMQFKIIEAYMSESVENCSEKFESFYKAHVYNSEYKSELRLVAHAFEKSLEEVHADVLENPLSVIYSGIGEDEY